MENDAQWLIKGSTQSMLRWHQFTETAATIGLLSQPPKIQRTWVRRPTGGGLMLHPEALSFALWIPRHHTLYAVRPLERYKKLHYCIAQWLQTHCKREVMLSESGTTSTYGAHQNCITQVALGDLLLDGAKIAGGAQRTTEKGFLYQGALLYAPLSSVLTQENIVEGVTQALDQFLHIHKNRIL